MINSSISCLLLFLFGVADGIVLMLTAISGIFQQHYLIFVFQMLGWAMAAFGGVWASRLDFRR